MQMMNSNFFPTGVIQLIVAVNKLDSVNWNQSRFEEIKSNMRTFLKTVGFRDSEVTYVPCSGLTGENLTKASTNEDLISWYKGPPLIDVIGKKG